MSGCEREDHIVNWLDSLGEPQRRALWDHHLKLASVELWRGCGCDYCAIAGACGTTDIWC